MLDDTPTSQHAHAFAAFADAGEEPDFVCAGDISASGRYGPTVVMVSRRRVVAVDPDTEPVHVLLDDVQDVTIDEGFGAARLMAVTAAGRVTLARYSRNLVPEFATLARVIEDLRGGREPILPDEQERALCVQCAAPLPDRGATCPLCLSRRGIARRLLKTIRPYRTQAILLVTASCLSVAFQMVPPYMYKVIADDVFVGGRRERLATWAGIMLGAFLGEGVFRFATNWLNIWLGSRVIADMRSQLHAQAQRLRMSYHNRHESGELISRVMHDTGELQHFIVDGLPYFLVNLLASVSIGVLLTILDWKLALLVFLPVPALILGGRFFWRIVRPLFHKHGTRRGALHTILGESIRGVRAIKGLAQENRRAATFDRANEQLFNVNTRVGHAFTGFFSSMSLLMAVGTVAVWYVGGRAVAESAGGGATLGTLLAFVGYIAMFYGPLQWFAAVFNWLSNALTSAERIFAVIDQPIECYDAAGSATAQRVRGEIRFTNVRFSYERGTEVIKGLDLHIAAGTMVGLVGKSGAGKSTIINLISRFYDPDSGAIAVDGTDLRRMDLHAWRRNIGIVMQQPFLFQDTILENIRYGAPDATFEDVVRAAKAARAHGFICQKEEGYDTVISEGGGGLSGGEQQRLAIAQAILHDPPVLILDEATSAVDSETEKQIQEAIAALIKGRTTIAIAHRLATLRNADRLVVIEDGRIIEQGTHAELLAKEEGHFARLVQLQTEINKLRSEQEVWQQ